MADCNSNSLEANDDIMSPKYQDPRPTIKRSSSRSPSTGPPEKSPRIPQPEHNPSIPSTGVEQSENQEVEGMVEATWEGLLVEHACPERLVGNQEGQAEEQGTQGEGPALSPRSRRKSWRRSARVRRSFPVLPSTTSGLCSVISLSLPEEERLEKLMESSMQVNDAVLSSCRYASHFRHSQGHLIFFSVRACARARVCVCVCVQHALQKLQSTLSCTPGASLDRLQLQVKTVQREWACLAQDIRGGMQGQPSQTNTDSDPGLQRTMEQIRKSIQSLQTECGLWDSLLLKHRSKAEELAGHVEQGQAEGVAMDTSGLAQSSQSQLILSKPDYHSALLRQQAVLHTMELLMDSHCKMMRELLSFQEQSQMLVKETSSRLASSAGFSTLPPSPIRRLLTGL